MLSLLQLQPEQLDCGAAHLQHPLSVLQPLKAWPVFRAPGLSSVAVASVGNYTVVFLGTVSGRLLKVRLGQGARRGWGSHGLDGVFHVRSSTSVHTSEFPFTPVSSRRADEGSRAQVACLWGPPGPGFRSRRSVCLWALPLGRLFDLEQ